MSSVTNNKMRAKRNKQKRIRKRAREKVQTGCRYCEYGLCASNADVAYCQIEMAIVNLKKDCENFKVKKN